MSLYDELPDCPCCRRDAIEAMTKSIVKPENLARMDPDDAKRMQRHLRKLLDRPDDSLPQLARRLATEVRKRVGIYQN